MTHTAPSTPALLELSGELDVYTLPSTERALAEIDNDVAIIDLTDVTFLNAATLGSFVAFQKRLRARRRLAALKIVVPLRFQPLFQITGLVKLFDIYETRAGAEAARLASDRRQRRKVYHAGNTMAFVADVAHAIIIC